MHLCDNPRCLNPEHLAAGTWNSNNKDRAAKGRSAKRIDSRRKISEELAQEIRQRWANRSLKRCSPDGILALARDYKVDTQTIYNIVKWKTHFA